MDRAADERAAGEARAVAAVRTDLERRGLGPAEARTRRADGRTLVLDARGWVHAVVSSTFDRRLRMYLPSSRDLRGEPWAPGSAPWEPRS